MAIQFSAKQKDVITRPFDYTLEVNEGTPRSSKTTAGAFRFALYLTMTDDVNHLVAAYNAELAYKLIFDCDGYGIEHIFKNCSTIKHDKKYGEYLEVVTPKGIRRVFWKGGGKADSHKAITGISLGSVVFCEINLLHMDFIQECFRRTFAAKNRYHLADLNPPAPNHPVIKEVFEVQRTRWQHWTIDDNPIITAERKQEIHDTLSKNPYLFARDWEGKRMIPEGVIYSMFDMQNNVINKLDGEIVEMFFAADGGQSDATSCSCNIVTKHYNDKGVYYKLNRVANYYHSGADSGQVKAMSIYAVEIKEFMSWCVDRFKTNYSEVFVDPACKSLREELELIGVDTSRANNNAKDIDSKVKGIEVGIERAQNAISQLMFVIMETEEKYSHYSFLQEIGMYARDKNGKAIDDNNHALDEFRYAINYFYTNYIL